MKLSNFIEGLLILQKHYADQDGYHIGAEHDQFYAYQTATPLEPAEVARMCELGWFQPDCGFEKPEDYSPAEGWSAYT